MAGCVACIVVDLRYPTNCWDDYIKNENYVMV